MILKPPYVYFHDKNIIRISIFTLLVSLDDPSIKLKAEDSGTMYVVCGTMAKID